MSKAFDRVCHSTLLLKLMDRNLPMMLIETLKCWYKKLFSCVKWGNALSNYYPIERGVRQGGVLSPILFSIYVDDLLLKLQLRCYISGECINSLMYADDLILLAISICDLQKIVNICVYELELVDMQINGAKTVCIRIGERVNEITADI